MNVNLKNTYAGLSLEVLGVANNGKGLKLNVEAMLDAIGVEYDYDNVGDCVKINGKLDGVDLNGWWDAYIDYNGNRVYLLSSKDYF